jgi:quercetin dioxygenase-like cupin family protein
MRPTTADLPIAFPFLVFALGCQHGAMLPSGPVTIASSGSSLGIQRTIIGRAPAHEAGWETRLYLIEYPPRAAAPPHVHPVVGVGWVIDGEFESAFGDDAVTTVKTGQSFTDLAGVPHRLFRNPSTEHPLRFVIAYTIRTGEKNFHPLP